VIRACLVAGKSRRKRMPGGGEVEKGEEEKERKKKKRKARTQTILLAAGSLSLLLPLWKRDPGGRGGEKKGKREGGCVAPLPLVPALWARSQRSARREGGGEKKKGEGKKKTPLA